MGGKEPALPDNHGDQVDQVADVEHGHDGVIMMSRMRMMRMMRMVISQRCNFSPPAKVMSGLWFKGLLLWLPDLSCGQLVCLCISVFVSFCVHLIIQS